MISVPRTCGDDARDVSLSECASMRSSCVLDDP
jgi:hypothetical protein